MKTTMDKTKKDEKIASKNTGRVPRRKAAQDKRTVNAVSPPETKKTDEVAGEWADLDVYIAQPPKCKRVVSPKWCLPSGVL